MEKSFKFVGFLLLVGCLLFNGHVRAQRLKDGWLGRQVYRIFNDTASAAAKSFTVYPTFGYAPETGIELGASALQLFRAKNDTLNRLSELQAFAFFTFKAQYGLWLDNAVYGDKDRWFFLGRTRIQRFPLFYYGIGPHTENANHAVVDAFSIAFKQRILRKISKDFFVGPEIDFQQLTGVSFNRPSTSGPTLPLGANGSLNLGLGAALVYDNRHNVLNVRKGFFGELSFLNYSPSLASDYRFSSINLDIRSFHALNKRNTFSWQFFGNFVQGDPPFNQLALMGGDMLMRGYYQGRYRDKNMLASQVEFRMLPFAFSKRVGGVLFGSVATVGPTIDQLHFSNLKWSGGFGLRYLLFPNKDIYIRLDIGFTQEGAGFYIFNGEAF
ncbi:BamA/TamA family outer membrane protein [Olivibacter sp. CPCC 100613]|uniref:BamA/TamA family outer membrane protein n=1 Tax=Olivibacter sp. CPCC 100613 TaxID=3079931 RepID=UPI002FF59F4B